LIDLDLSNRNLFEDEFLIEFEYLFSLKKLKLSKNNFCNLPSWISCLPKLGALDLSECTSLQSISLPTSVIELTANGCTSLERISILTNESSGSLERCIPSLKFASSLRHFNRKLFENLYYPIHNGESWQQLNRKVHLGSCNNLSSESMNSVLQVLSLLFSSLLFSSLLFSLSFFDANTFFEIDDVQDRLR
jgi:hypothetical protein